MMKYNKIVIGCTLSSVLYSFYNQIPLIFVEKQNIHPFNFFQPGTDLSLLKIEPSYSLKKPDGQKVAFGVPRQKVYDKIIALLSLSGLVPFSHLSKALTVKDKSLKVITQGNKVFNVGYESLIVFDDKGVSGLPSIVRENKEQPRQVIDWFEVNKGGIHDVDYIQTDDEFVKEIFFYPSQRATNSPDKKDLLAVSYLTHQQATRDYQYSDTYSRFKVLKCIKEAGIRGSKNGKNPNYPDRSTEPFKWLSPRIKLMKREIMSPSMARYKNTKNIKFCYDTPESIIAKNVIKINAYSTKLLNAL